MSEDFNAPENVPDNSGALVEQVKIELNDIDNSDLTEHAARFDALHGSRPSSSKAIS